MEQVKVNHYLYKPWFHSLNQRIAAKVWMHVTAYTWSYLWHILFKRIGWFCSWWSVNCVYSFNTAINRLGPPTDVNTYTVVEETSLILSWQSPLLLNSPDVIVCYKISLNVSTSLHPLSTLTQFMLNCTVDTTYNFSFSAIGINRCNEDYLVEVHVAGVDMAQVEGDFARITKMIPSTQICSPTGIPVYMPITYSW